jgi:membrane protein DedA with SNARE-associated domain
LVVGIGVVVVLVSVGGDDGFGQLQPDNPTRTYFLVFFLVAADAVIPIFPGETTLNAASTVAANGDLELWLVIVLAALGALVGDSSLYWIARRSSSSLTPPTRASPQEHARRRGARLSRHCVRGAGYAESPNSGEGSGTLA